MSGFLKAIAAVALMVGALIGTVGTSDAQYNGYYNQPYGPARSYYDAYAYAPRYGYRHGYNPWSRSTSLNHGQGPGCIQSPASIEYTGCD